VEPIVAVAADGVELVGLAAVDYSRLVAVRDHAVVFADHRKKDMMQDSIPDEG
jgi:hypothetical protein